MSSLIPTGKDINVTSERPSGVTIMERRHELDPHAHTGAPEGAKSASEGDARHTSLTANRGSVGGDGDRVDVLAGTRDGRQGADGVVVAVVAFEWKSLLGRSVLPAMPWADPHVVTLKVVGLPEAVSKVSVSANGEILGTYSTDALATGVPWTVIPS